MAENQEDKLSAAMAAVEGGSSQRAAAKLYGVSATTLSRRRRGGLTRSEGKESSLVLSSDLEKELVASLLHYEKLGRSLHRREIHQIAASMLRAQGKPDHLGKNWVDRFLQRHPGIRTKHQAALEAGRSARDLSDQIQPSSERDKAPRKKRNFQPRRVANNQPEKPVSVIGLGTGAANMISEDIRGLYKDIRVTSQFKQHIVPLEVRDQFLAVEEDTPEFTFREPNAEGVPSSYSALSTHDTLLRIVRAATKSEQYKRSEAAWNHHVHTPLLELVFGSDPWEPDGVGADQPAVARFEAVMGSTISSVTIPFIQSSQPDQQPNLACPVPLDRSADRSNASSTGAIDLGRTNLNKIHNHSESKKVDYVLVMYINEKEKLRQVIWDSTFEDEFGYGYANQASQLNLLHSPIAVPIRTRITPSQVGPLVQVGPWISAWHKRMCKLRDRLFPLTLSPYLPTGSTQTPRRLVSVPLIEVASHEWLIYFACDSDLSINVYGPLRLGSTATVLEIYTLVASLACVKRWIETTFHEAIEAWFMQA